MTTSQRPEQQYTHVQNNNPPPFIVQSAGNETTSYSVQQPQQTIHTTTTTLSHPITTTTTTARKSSAASSAVPMSQYSGTQLSYVHQGQTSGTRMMSGATTEGSRVIGREYGEHRLVSVTERVDESRQQVVSERYVDTEIKVPRRIVREEIIEKIIVVPERIMKEEMIEETQIVRNKIVEVSKPTIIEKVIEIPEIEILERIVEVPEKIIQEKIVEVPKYITQERIVPVERIQVTEKYVDVPEVRYRDTPVEKIVERPEYREEIIIKEVPITQYIEKQVPNYVNVEVPVDIRRDLPIPVEAEITYEYRMPQLKPRYSKSFYKVYLPRFIEVPVAREVLSEELCQQAEGYLNRIHSLTQSAVSLCEVEGLAAKIMETSFQSHLARSNLEDAVKSAWASNSIAVRPSTTSDVRTTIQTTTTTTMANENPSVHTLRAH